MQVELSHLAGRRSLKNDGGGRTPNYNAVNVYRSLLADGANLSVDDGVEHEDHEHSASISPFLESPDAKPVMAQMQ
jgi:hypothetical protein